MPAVAIPGLPIGQIATGDPSAATTVRAPLSATAALSPVSGMTSVTSGRPIVTVPVLSITTVSTLASASRYRPPLTTIPCRAACPAAASTVIGVAMAIAHEQATSTVATAAVALPPIRYVASATASTTGM